jgi:hypothetical protein
VLLTAGSPASLRYLQKVEGEVLVCPDHTTMGDYAGRDSSCIDAIAIRHIKQAMVRSEGEMSNDSSQFRRESLNDWTSPHMA